MDATLQTVGVLSAISDLIDAATEADRDAEEACQQGAQAAEPLAQRYAPKLTGELKSSVHARGSSLVVEADHGRFVHDGTARMPPRPFAKRALNEITPDLVSDLYEGPSERILGRR